MKELLYLKNYHLLGWNLEARWEQVMVSLNLTKANCYFVLLDPLLHLSLRTVCNNLKNVMVGQCLGLKLNIIHTAKNLPVGEIIVNSPSPTINKQPPVCNYNILPFFHLAHYCDRPEAWPERVTKVFRRLYNPGKT